MMTRRIPSLVCCWLSWMLYGGTTLTTVFLPPTNAFDLTVVAPTLTASSSHVATLSSSLSSSSALLQHLNPAQVYMQVLTTFPLSTKMVTGATLAVAGDAIAQTTQAQAQVQTPQQHDNNDDNATVVAFAYDRRRAMSFAVFDAAYRALQHVAYPAIVAYFHGQFICSAVSLVLAQYYLPLDVAAGLERTLCSQLMIVPLIYYPVFFTLTAALQGLDWNAGVARARTMFGPLMARNLLFWIPAQYIQFSFVPEDLQIPFGSVCGLAWTFVLSVLAGAAAAAQHQHQHQHDENDLKQSSSDAMPTTAAAAATEQPPQVYCVTGVEDQCQLPDDLFPHASLEDVAHELEHEMQEIAHYLFLDHHPQQQQQQQQQLDEEKEPIKVVEVVDRVPKDTTFSS